MNALDLIGLASDVTGLSSTIINKLQPEDYQYRSFMNVIDKTKAHLLMRLLNRSDNL